MVSSIMAQNPSTSATDIETNATTATLNVNATDSIISWVTDTGVNVISSGSTTVGTGSAFDAKLDVLAANGSTRQTHALLAGSYARNNGSNPDALSFDQRGTPNIRDKGQTDMGAFEDQTSPDAPTVSTITFGDGTGQRSLVTQMIVTFSAPVTFTGDVTAAITLSRNGTNSQTPGGSGTVGLIASPANGTATSVTITFAAGTFVQAGSLIDGFYDISMDADQIKGDGGKLNGGAGWGTDYNETGTTANKHFRLFGDSDGNATVDFLIDFIAFRNAFATPTAPASLALFDFDGSGAVDFLSDFIAFRNRFNNPNTP